MEALTVVVVIIMVIGALMLGAVGIAALIFGWWFIIPLAGAAVGGWLGFIFGLGLVGIIGLFVAGCRKS